MGSTRDIPYGALDGRDSTSDTDGFLNHHEQHVEDASKKSYLHGRLRWGLVVLSFLVVNGIWFYASHVAHTRGVIAGVRSARVNSMAPKTVLYEWETGYADNNLSHSNPMWSDLFPVPGYGAITVSPEWAKAMGYSKDQVHAVLPSGEELYVISAFHELHCLALIRASLYQFKNGFQQKSSWAHITHCFDGIRQHIMCMADAQPGGHSIEMQCNDWDGLVAWAEERGSSLHDLGLDEENAELDARSHVMLGVGE